MTRVKNNVIFFMIGNHNMTDEQTYEAHAYAVESAEFVLNLNARRIGGENAFCLMQNFSSTPQPASWLEILSVMKSERVAKICSQLNALDPNDPNYNDKKSSLKKQLPCITVHSCGFDGNKRSNETAYPNGYACLEFDHLTDIECEQLLSAVSCVSEVLLASRSASNRGVWLLFKSKPGEDIKAAQKRIFDQISSKIGFADKVDFCSDLSRLRYLVPESYINFGINVKFESDPVRVVEDYYDLHRDFLDYVSTLPPTVPVGERHNKYKRHCIEALALEKNTVVIQQHLPSYGLPEKEIKEILEWASREISSPVLSKQTQEKMSIVQRESFSIPLDSEALPYPKQAAPKLIKELVKGLPSCWKQTATLALLPALSVAAGKCSYGVNKKPLAFQVAVYGEAGSGKSEFTCGPAREVQSILSEKDNAYRAQIEQKGSDLQCPRVMGFEISTVQLAKYLQYAKDQTVMLYTDEISSSLGNERSNNGFLQLQPVLRKGFDGISTIMDYKDIDSFRGAISPRLSFLACGTPGAMFKYFSPSSTEQGSTRRVILIEHPICEKEQNPINYDEKSKAYIQEELNYLIQQNETLDVPQIEQAYKNWKLNKQREAGADKVKYLAVNTPAETLKRAAYLCHILNHYDKSQLKKAIQFGIWVAEYQLRSYTNQSYTILKEDEKNNMKYMAPSTQKEQAKFNEQMYQNLPCEFTKDDLIAYRRSNHYPHDLQSMAVVNRWKANGQIIQIGKKTYKKMK